MTRSEPSIERARRACLLIGVALLVACVARESPPQTTLGAAGETALDASSRAISDRASEVRCRDNTSLRNAYFGELHVHTARSLDAYTFETPGTPDDAYRFATGEPIDFAGDRRVQLERPLDFSAVTDHASSMGELRLCIDPESPVYDHRICRIVRENGPSQKTDDFERFESALNVVTGGGVGTPLRNRELCGEDFALCKRAMDGAWLENRRAAERFQDRTTACRFTTFNGYEYTATPDFAKVHRNVIFRDARVPDRVVAWVDEPSRWGLWETLRDDCLDAGDGCDAITIPHNSNMSNGQMFAIDYRDEPLERQRERARLWQRLEPLIEVMQTKGSMECRNGLWQVYGGRDPQCDFEKWRALDPAPPPCRGGTEAGAILGKGCQSRVDFSRYALVEGLREKARIGVNPIKLGHSASTDMHNANPGDTEERSFDGVRGADDRRPDQRLVRHMPALAPAAFNPGGLTGVWAEQNSRHALFDAMRRRETFGTSGTRIEPRFFASWRADWAAETSPGHALCNDRRLLERAYAEGVPMGADLPARPDGEGAPRFLVAATRDPGAPGIPSLPLQKIEIVKAWPGAGDAMHQAVYTVAGTAESDAGVDLATCEPIGAGHDTLCGVWSDPDFDPEQHAVYYARVLENPSCRWSTFECNAFAPEDRPASCDDPILPKTIQERAWTSPIWYAPATRIAQDQ